MEHRHDECRAIGAELVELAYEELAPARRAAVRRHVASCASCADALRELQEARALLSDWSLPDSDDDPRTLAAEIAARARRARPRRPWRALRVASMAAAVLLAFLAVLGSSLRYADGELVLSVRLPGVGTPAGAAARAIPEAELRRVAADEVAAHDTVRDAWLHDWTRRQEEEREKLVQAIDRLRAEDQRAIATMLEAVASENVRENKLTRDALFDLVAVVSNENPR